MKLNNPGRRAGVRVIPAGANLNCEPAAGGGRRALTRSCRPVTVARAHSGRQLRRGLAPGRGPLKLRLGARARLVAAAGEPRAPARACHWWLLQAPGLGPFPGPRALPACRRQAVAAGEPGATAQPGPAPGRPAAPASTEAGRAHTRRTAAATPGPRRGPQRSAATMRLGCSPPQAATARASVGGPGVASAIAMPRPWAGCLP
jgi:hypothetical protein